MSAIDPGMDNAIQDNAERVQDDSQPQQECTTEDDLRSPSRWWFASTACPLLAGTFGPMASAFSICALVYSWRVYIPPTPGSVEQHGIPLADPPWLIAINAISLVSALAANASLLLNMTRRLSFSIAQPITITGFFVSGMLLIADMVVLAAMPAYGLTPTNVPNHPDAVLTGRHALTGAFYYAIFAAAIYVIIGLLMCLTVYGAQAGHYDKHFRLTPSQRTLMLQTMSFIAYLLLGAWVFSNIEGWLFLDAFYWADVTLLTVGMGDMSPSTNLGRGLLFPFAIGGILMVGLVVGSIRTLILERGKEKLEARITEKKRFHAVHKLDIKHQTIRVGYFTYATFSADPALSPVQRREAEFHVMRKVQSSSERERRWMALAVSSTFALILWFVGAAVFKQCEHGQQWTYFQSLYFAYTSLLTIGYGDLSPMSNSGKPVFVLWSLLAVPSLTILISNMGDTVVRAFTQLTDWLGSLTVLPGEESGSGRAKLAAGARHLTPGKLLSSNRFLPPGIFGAASTGTSTRLTAKEHERQALDSLASRLLTHVEEDELKEALQAEAAGDDLERDVHFYHHVLSREARRAQQDLNASPPKKYSWEEWEYFLRLVSNGDDSDGSLLRTRNHHMRTRQAESSTATTSNPSDPEKVPLDPSTSRKSSQPSDLLAPGPFASSEWTWLSPRSPLMCEVSEAEWVLGALSRALERELGRQRRGGSCRPPVGFMDLRQGEGWREQEELMER